PPGLTLSESSSFAPISPEDLDLESLSLGRLYHLWVSYLVELKKRTAVEKSWKVWLKWRKSPDVPEVAFSHNTIKVLSLDESMGEFHWQLLAQDKFVPTRPVLLFDRHGKCRQPGSGKGSETDKAPEWTPNWERIHDSILHYES